MPLGAARDAEADHCADAAEQQRIQQENIKQQAGTLKAAHQSAIRAYEESRAAILQAILLLWTLCAAIWAGFAARDAAKAANDSVGKADETLRHARETNERELRAYVFVHLTELETRKIKKANPFVGSPTVTVRIPTGRVSYSYENTGKTPAKNVSVAARAILVKTGDPVDVTAVGDLKLIGPLGPKSVFSRQLDIENAPLHPSQIKSDTEDGSHEIHLFGRIEYETEFAKDRWTTFHCYIGGSIGYDRTLHAVEPGNDYA